MKTIVQEPVVNPRECKILSKRLDVRVWTSLYQYTVECHQRTDGRTQCYWYLTGQDL